MGSERILSLDLAQSLEKMAGFRNILVHDYIKVDSRRVYKILQTNLKDIEDYLKEIVDCLRL